MSGISKKTLDTLMSHYVRARVDWTCERCGKQFEPGSQAIHASHYQGRRHHGTRWDDRNLFGHCATCHRTLEENRALFDDWAEKQLGADVAADLRMTAQQPTRIRGPEKKRIAAELREKLRSIGEEPTV